MRYSREYKTQHQDIIFTLRTRRIQLIEDIGKEYQKINKEPDTKNLENLPKYKINLLEDMPKKLNAKAYIITVKKDKA